jgi:DNA-binding ferritin-like protein
MADTEQRRVEEIQEAQREMGSTADELSERSDELGGHINDAKQTLAQTKADSSVPTASSDWEDTEPDDKTAEDATGFDDPEDLDLDDEDLDDDTADDDEDD